MWCGSVFSDDAFRPLSDMTKDRLPALQAVSPTYSYPPKPVITPKDRLIKQLVYSVE